jgi:ABC-type oligopeptide transport system ATPase subunit
MLYSQYTVLTVCFVACTLHVAKIQSVHIVKIQSVHIVKIQSVHIVKIQSVHTYSQDTDKIQTRYRQDTDKIQTRYSQDTDKIQTRYRQDTDRIQTRYSQDTDKIVLTVCFPVKIHTYIRTCRHKVNSTYIRMTTKQSGGAKTLTTVNYHAVVY